MSPIPGLGRVGLLGGGVIGGGWAARFLLNGVDVVLYDPDPDAPRKVGEVVDNARHALGRLVSVPLPPEGDLRFVDSPEAAATDVDFVQESAPERLELKRQLLDRASTAAGPDVVFGSSTSGLLPTEMQRSMTHPQRLVVGHPFNPVYLLPLVEVVGGTQTAPQALERAAQVYESIGMQPVRLHRELDGFVADRLLEALWREALWLVNDGVATVEEIDDCIRFGAGLRWSFMGTFLTYRIAGGEAGMRHFMAQFGPALQWPWTKLTDVPELTDVLLDTIVEQSDAQARGRTIRELERHRDESLVAVMHGLRSTRVGAGLVLDRYERQLFARLDVPASAADSGRPLRLHDVTVPAEWVDYNGHMNDSRYFQLSSETVDRFLRHLGMDERYLAGGHSWFTVESHLVFVDQARLGDRLYATLQVLSADDKRMRVFTSLRRGDGDGEVEVATAEHLLLHVDTRAGTSCPALPSMSAALRAVADAHATLAAPPAAGRAVGQPRG